MTNPSYEISPKELLEVAKWELADNIEHKFQDLLPVAICTGSATIDAPLRWHEGRYSDDPNPFQLGIWGRTEEGTKKLDLTRFLSPTHKYDKRLWACGYGEPSQDPRATTDYLSFNVYPDGRSEIELTKYKCRDLSDPGVCVGGEFSGSTSDERKIELIGSMTLALEAMAEELPVLQAQSNIGYRSVDSHYGTFMRLGSATSQAFVASLG